MTHDRHLSKTLAYWLRHRPDTASLTLDGQGWTDVRSVLDALGKAGIACDTQQLIHVVDANDKQRFELSPDRQRIRARQGHSVAVKLDWPRKKPPDLLYHGTVEHFLPAILAQGLRPMLRHHVHLSPDVEAAWAVGSRRGKPIVLSVRAAELDAMGQPFFLTSNGVWLTAEVPPDYLTVADTRAR